MKYYVYAYCNPLKSVEYTVCDCQFTFEPFYIGYGSANRSNSHLIEATTTTTLSFKLNTIRKLIRNGLPPIIVKLKECLSREAAIQLEISLIAHFGTKAFVKGLKTGCLTNLAKGGHGGAWHITPEFREKQSKRFKGVPKSAEQRAKISATKTGNTHHDDAARKNISEKTIIALQDPERRKKISDTHKGKPKSAEQVANMTIANNDPVKLAKVKATKIANGTYNFPKQSAESIAKMAASLSLYLKQTNWINDGTNNKRIPSSELQAFLDDGWLKGRIMPKNSGHKKNH